MRIKNIYLTRPNGDPELVECVICGGAVYATARDVHTRFHQAHN